MDTKFYRELPNNPTSEFKNSKRETLLTLCWAELISRRMLKEMLAAHSVPGCFHLLPKMHTPGSPGRPIVSSNNISTENVLEFINYPIEGIPAIFPSYLKDTNHFINEISDLSVPVNSFLMTMDVCFLCTNIPHRDGIAATVSADEKSGPSAHVGGEGLSLFWLVLNHNRF